MEQTPNDIRSRLRVLADDLARAVKAAEESPEALQRLRPTLQAIREAVQEVHDEVNRAVQAGDGGARMEKDATRHDITSTE